MDLHFNILHFLNEFIRALQLPRYPFGGLTFGLPPWGMLSIVDILLIRRHLGSFSHISTSPSVVDHNKHDPKGGRE